MLLGCNQKKYYESTLRTIAEHFQPFQPDQFLLGLCSLTEIPIDSRIDALGQKDFNRLVWAIEKLCEYSLIGNESFLLLPKIIAKIHNDSNQDPSYLIEDNSLISKQTAIEHVLSHQLDAVLVHEANGKIHLRSRPRHTTQQKNIYVNKAEWPSSEGKIETLVRSVGSKRKGQCIWGFINGISNNKKTALESASYISKMAKGEQVLSMPNDEKFPWLGNFAICCALKAQKDTFIVAWALKFIRFLLKLAESEIPSPCVILFAHSQGAVIAAVELLSKSERQKLRIFTFGGGSFLLPDKCHPDSHNYASPADAVSLLGSPNHQYLAL